MNREETTKLTRYVKAACPQQAIDDFTPDVWFDFLRDLDVDDCIRAVRAIIDRQPFVAVSEIIAEVKRIRTERLSNSDLALPAADPADEQAYRKALSNIRRQVGDGRMPFRAIAGGKPAEPSAKYKATRSAEDNDRVLAQTVACPVEWCPARPGEPCRPAPEADPIGKWHPSRLKAARLTQAI